MQSPLIYEYKGSIKFYKKYDTQLANLAGVEYKGYKIADLPPSFGFKDDGEKQAGPCISQSIPFGLLGLTC